MNWKHPITLAIYLGLLLSACKKGSDPSAIEIAASLKFATAKRGDTLVVTGHHFSKNATRVTLHDQEIDVVNATDTELTIVIPDNATSGNVAVIANGRIVDLGTLTIVPLTLYCVKHDMSDINNSTYQVIAINPENGNTSVLLDVTRINEFDYIHGLKYLPATNEIIGFAFRNRKLLKINVATKETTIVPLTTDFDTDYSDLILDKYGDLYAIKHQPLKHTLIKIDPITGTQTDVVSYATDWEHLVYIPTNNEMVGLAYSGMWIIRANLTTKEILKIDFVDPSSVLSYSEMVAVGSEIYGYNGVRYIVKIDQFTGIQTVIKTPQPDDVYQRNWVYVHQRKAIYSLHHAYNGFDIGLYWYDMNTQQFGAFAPLTTVPLVDFYDLTSN